MNPFYKLYDVLPDSAREWHGYEWLFNLGEWFDKTGRWACFLFGHEYRGSTYIKDNMHCWDCYCLRCKRVFHAWGSPIGAK